MRVALKVAVIAPRENPKNGGIIAEGEEVD
jgi:hypothetical protein